MSQFPSIGNGPLIGIQTHLSGMKTKQWSMENWTGYLKLLLAHWPDVRLVLFDTSPLVEKLLFSSQISTTLGFSLAQSIRLLQRLDLMISIDSWTKYVATAANVPQVIVVPDQRSEYPALTADRMLVCEHSGVFTRSDVTTVGLCDTPPRLTLSNLKELTPQRLFEVSRLRLEAMGRMT